MRRGQERLMRHRLRPGRGKRTREEKVGQEGRELESEGSEYSLADEGDGVGAGKGIEGFGRGKKRARKEDTISTLRQSSRLTSTTPAPPPTPRFSPLIPSVSLPRDVNTGKRRPREGVVRPWTEEEYILLTHFRNPGRRYGWRKIGEKLNRSVHDVRDTFNLRQQRAMQTPKSVVSGFVEDVFRESGQVEGVSVTPLSIATPSSTVSSNEGRVTRSESSAELSLTEWDDDKVLLYMTELT